MDEGVPVTPLEAASVASFMVLSSPVERKAVDRRIRTSRDVSVIDFEERQARRDERSRKARERMEARKREAEGSE